MSIVLELFVICVAAVGASPMCFAVKEKETRFFESMEACHVHYADSANALEAAVAKDGLVTHQVVIKCAEREAI